MRKKLKTNKSYGIERETFHCKKQSCNRLENGKPARWNHMANRSNSGETSNKPAKNWRILLKNTF
jgi:hypothetical protein